MNHEITQAILPVATLLLVMVFLILLLLAALWINRLSGKYLQMWHIIQSGDSEKAEAARSWITPAMVPFLIHKYWQATDWSRKRIVVELLQDQDHPKLPKLMLDFLRVPLTPGDEPTELAQAIALRFMGEKYDRFADYYSNRDLLAGDVRAVLAAHGLVAEPPPPPPPPPAKPDTRVFQGEPPNRRLIYGVGYNDLPMVQQALRDQANINAAITHGDQRGCSALIFAILLGHYEIAQFLIEQGADIHFTRSDLQGNFIPGRGQTALWWAASQGHLPLVKELLQRGANINAPDHFDGTPLTTAASAGQLEVVRYLVEQGANIHAKLTTDYGRGVLDGRNALHLAVNKGHVAVAETLLEAGNDPNEYDGYGYTPLMVAAQNNLYEMAEMLLSHRTEVNAVHGGFGSYIGVKGLTPLAFAVSAGLVRMSRLLIQAGADVHYRVPAGTNWDGKSLPERGMLDFATFKGKRGESLRNLLRQHGLR
jgi:ankyrin repeat protein